MFLNRSVPLPNEYWVAIASVIMETDFVRQTEITFVLTQGTVKRSPASVVPGGSGGTGAAGGGSDDTDLLWQFPEPLLPVLENRPLILHRHFAR